MDGVFKKMIEIIEMVQLHKRGKMSENKMIRVKRVGRPRMRWVNNVFEILGDRGVTVEQAEIVYDKRSF